MNTTETQFEDGLIQLHPDDPIAIAKRDLSAGERICLSPGQSLTIQEDIPAGHKAALVALQAGQSVLRYGCPIGKTTAAVDPGGWLHSHNLVVLEDSSDYTHNEAEPWPIRPSPRTFLGYQRANGKVGTRNYIAVISTVNCSAHVAAQIARAFPIDELVDYPNVDGVIPILHASGCSLPPAGLSHIYLKRALANVAANPNIAAAIYVGLGCEVMQWQDCQPLFSQAESSALSPLGLVIQEQGGFVKTVAAGIEALKSLLPQVNALKRTPQPLARLSVALQCGGSDSWSGITANPLVGKVVDALVREGASAVLAETPEIFGAEHILLQRVASAETARKLIERFQWWANQARRRGFSIDNNPTPGNKKGGLTTIYEKSLGAVAKAGSSPLNGVYEYAEMVDRAGLVFMDTPGNDPISVTGQLAGGCNLILFTTGRGTVYGSNLAPCIKIASNSTMYARLSNDMDFNAGQILEGNTWEDTGQALLDLSIQAASGQRTCSERHGLSENEFAPWQPDAVL